MGHWYTSILQPAAFGRLCVETDEMFEQLKENIQPPSGGCVLKHGKTSNRNQARNPSRLRAAVC